MGVKIPKSQYRKPRSVSMTDALWKLADKRASSLKLGYGGVRGTSEYIRMLVQEDLKQAGMLEA